VNDHPTILRNPDFLGTGDAPHFLRRTDERFLEGLLEQLEDEEGRRLLKGKVLPTASEKRRGEGIKLYLPVHRCFNLVVMEAVCDTPGYPRLDPQKIHSAGMVIRRIPRPNQQLERYLVRESRVIGWKPLPTTERLLDPEPAYRPRPHMGNADLDRMIAKMQKTVDETEVVARLFPAPPEVCAAAGRTLLYGLVPVTDSEVVEEDIQPTTPNKADIQAVIKMLPGWLARKAPNGVPTVPTELTGRKVRVVEVKSERVVQVKSGSGNWSRITLPEPGAGTGWKLADFMRMLWQFRIELDAFSGSNEGEKILEILNQQNLVLPDGRSVKMGDWLAEASRVLVRAETGIEVQMPTSWPTFPADKVTLLAQRCFGALDSKARSSTGNRGRFSSKVAHYELWPFMRVHCEEGCGPKIVWGKPSARYTLASWFEGPPEGAKIPQLELPDISRAFLEKVRPNIAIKVPKPLFNLLRNNAPGDFLKGEANNNTDGFDFVWICSFSIPIITIVAFILLFIMLILLNLIFWWLPFVKICIPLPGTLARKIGDQ
jgi:hypothetical protein